jgi:molecular chaperone DnaK
VERQLSALDRLTSAAYYRHPSAWRWQFERASADLSRASDLPRAHALVQQGRAALAAGDTEQLRAATLALRNLLPADPHPLLAVGPRSGLR